MDSRPTRVCADASGRVKLASTLSTARMPAVITVARLLVLCEAVPCHLAPDEDLGTSEGRTVPAGAGQPQWQRRPCILLSAVQQSVRKPGSMGHSMLRPGFQPCTRAVTAAWPGDVQAPLDKQHLHTAQPALLHFSSACDSGASLAAHCLGHAGWEQLTTAAVQPISSCAAQHAEVTGGSTCTGDEASTGRHSAMAAAGPARPGSGQQTTRFKAPRGSSKFVSPLQTMQVLPACPQMQAGSHGTP